MLVEDTGPPDAKIMLVGEAPGAEEERIGKPFVGQSGKLLKQMLLHSGIDFSKCYVTNVVNERPPNNDFSFFYEDRQLRVPSPRLEGFREELRKKVLSIRPNVVVCLGREPLKALTGEGLISEWRGTVMTYKDIKILPTYHPAAVMREFSMHPIVEMDFTKALVESLSPEVKKKPIDLLLSPTLGQAIEWMEKANHEERVAFDIETIGEHVRCIALAYGKPSYPHVICIPFIRFGGSSSLTSPSVSGKIVTIPSSSEYSSYWEKHQEVVILQKLSSLLENKYVQKTGQNSIAFDAPLLENEFGISIENHYIDIMHAWHVLYPELPKGLDFLSSILTDYPNYWTHLDTSSDLSEWRYNAMDAVVTLECSYKIEQELREQATVKRLDKQPSTMSLMDFYKTHVHRLVVALQAAAETGVRIDSKVKTEEATKASEALKKAREELAIIAKEDINPESPKQIKELLYEKMKFPVVYSKSDRATTDEEALRKLERQYPNEPVLAKIIECRKWSTLLSTFLSVEPDEDGRMRTSYNASGTETGRISSSKTIRGTGMNLQNVPVGKGRGVQNIRHVFVTTSDGYSFVKGDLRQAEAMVVSEILRSLGDTSLSSKYDAGGFDIHRWMASYIFRKAEKDVTKREREVGKLSNHSGNYAAGPRVLLAKALKDGIDEVDWQMAKYLVDVRHSAIPGLRVWWESVNKQLLSTRTLSTVFGRRRIFFGRVGEGEGTLRDAYAYVPQSTVADVCNRIFYLLYEHFLNIPTVNVILQVHDEVVVECPETLVPMVVHRMEEVAKSIQLWICEDRPLVIPIDISVGKNWRDCLPITV